MAITVKHKFVSAIPDSGDTTIVQPSNWNDDHELTGTIPVANGGTGASTLTGYVKGNGTSPMTASTTIPNTDVTGLGTMSTQNANNVNITGGSISGATVSGYIPTSAEGVPNGVATLDSGGQIPLSQIPPLGDLNYQGTWNANLNIPVLVSSVGVKGYYYVVSVAGNTNLNGITDWQVGDWAVFDGTVWEKIDNTDSVTSVNGYTGTVVLNYTDVGAFPATATTGTGNVVLQTSPTINTPTLSGATVDGSAPYMNYTPTTAPTYVEGRVFYDSSAHTLNYYNDNSQMSLNIGQEQIVRVRNQTGSQINNGQVVYISGATGNTPLVTLAIATSFSTSDIIGVATVDIANNGFGYITVNGLVNGLDTSAFADGNPVFVSATTAGALTATEPTAPNYSVQVGVILRANPSNGTLLVAPQQISVEVAHIVGTVSVSQGGTGQTSYTDGQLLIGNTTGNTLTKSTLTAGTGISVTNGNGSITITNTSPSSGGTVTSVSGTAPISVATGTTTPVISMPAATTSVSGYLTSTDWNTFNSKQPAGTYVTSVSGTTGRITSSGGTTPAIDLASGIVTAGTTGSSSLIPVVTVDTYGRVTAITTAANPQGTVTSVGGTGTVSGITLSGTVTSSGNLTLGGTLDLSAPPVIGGTTPNLITGTTITATKYVGVSGGTF